MEVKEKNRSSTYLVPLLNQYVEINKALLLNSYIYDVNNPEINIPNINGILLLLKWSDNDVHKVYEQRLLESKHMAQYYDITADTYMGNIKIPLDIAKDVNFILEGKYSKIEEKNKSLILKYWQFGATTKLYNVLYKNPQYKKDIEDSLNVKLREDAELASVFDLHLETYSKIIKQVELR